MSVCHGAVAAQFVRQNRGSEAERTLGATHITLYIPKFPFSIAGATERHPHDVAGEYRAREFYVLCHAQGTVFRRDGSHETHRRSQLYDSGENRERREMALEAFSVRIEHQIRLERALADR